MRCGGSATQVAARAGVVAALVVALMWAGAGAVSASITGSMVSLINQARSADGLTGVESHEDLAAVASAWAQVMADDGDISHNPGLEDQVPDGWVSTGENVAFSSDPSAQVLHDMLMDSPGHRQNILGDFTHVGVGYAEDEAGAGYVVEVFAQYRSDSGPSGTGGDTDRSSGEDEDGSEDSSPATGTDDDNTDDDAGSDGAGRDEGEDGSDPDRGWLAVGARGQPVVQVQELLEQREYAPGPVDGVFGPLTRDAVVAFQRDHDLSVDGVVGEDTWEALTSSSEESEPSPEPGEQDTDEPDGGSDTGDPDDDASPADDPSSGDDKSRSGTWQQPFTLVLTPDQDDDSRQPRPQVTTPVVTMLGAAASVVTTRVVVGVSDLKRRARIRDVWLQGQLRSRLMELF